MVMKFWIACYPEGRIYALVGMGEDFWAWVVSLELDADDIVVFIMKSL